MTGEGSELDRSQDTRVQVPASPTHFLVFDLTHVGMEVEGFEVGCGPLASLLLSC